MTLPICPYPPRRRGREKRCEPAQMGIELVDGRSDTKVFYKTFNRESLGEESENVQRDSESGADQEIVDVILSGKVCTARVLLSSPLPFPCAERSS
jgi:hypothetical protein